MLTWMLVRVCPDQRMLISAVKTCSKKRNNLKRITDQSSAYPVSFAMSSLLQNSFSQ